jgi:magnesium transporter
MTHHDLQAQAASPPLRAGAPLDLDGPVAPHVRRQFTRLHADQSVDDALASLRANPPAERIIYLYVVDAGGRLEGIVPTRRLLLSPPRTPIRDIMIRRVVALPVEATVQEACEFFIQHRFLAFPVVDAERRLLGVVDVDLYTDELTNLGDARLREELFQRIGVHVAGEKPGALPAFVRRFPWLGCNLAGGILAAILSGVFETTLQNAVALTFFVPVVLNLAESVSSQSVSLTLHLLQTHRPSWKSLPGLLRIESLTGLLLGAACGAVIAGVAFVWPGEKRVAAALLGGIAGGVTLSAVLGLTVPLLLRLLRLDPRVAAGPIVLAGADILTILCYFSLARWLLGG